MRATTTPVPVLRVNRDGAAPEGFAADYPRAVPPSRQAVTISDPRGALGLDSVYRAVALIQGAAQQISIDVWRDGQRLEGDAYPGIISSPSADTDTTDLVGELVASLAIRGNAYALVTRSMLDNRPIGLRVLDPTECVPTINRETGARAVLWRGRSWEPTDLLHLRLTRIPGAPEGLGPIQACMGTLDAAARMRDFADDWTRGAGVPSGVLSSDQPITAEQAAAAKSRWNENNSISGGVAVLGAGLTYTALKLKPSEVQFIESRQFDVLAIGRMFGIPAHLFLAAVNGTSMTYTNVVDSATDFVRWTLMQYLRPIEASLTKVLPRRTVARFNLDALLRASTGARMNAHKTAIEAGIYGPEWARQIEGIPEPAAPTTNQTTSKETA